MGRRINRRRILQAAAGLPFVSALLRRSAVSAATPPRSRVRPGDPGWPLEADWTQLGRDVGGNIIKVQSPLAACVGQTNEDCANSSQSSKTRISSATSRGSRRRPGWGSATGPRRPSVYAVAVRTTAERCHGAVNFARDAQSSPCRARRGA